MPADVSSTRVAILRKRAALDFRPLSPPRCRERMIEFDVGAASGA